MVCIVAEMNRPDPHLLTHVVCLAAVVIPGMTLGCSGGKGSGSFAGARRVIETNCVQCHGEARLAQMPAFGDTRAIANLVGPNKWIVPGHPERSRFFQVVTFSDEQVGAMPPTGHQISKRDIETLRAWIQAGAQVPAGASVQLIPRGDGPRSR